LAGQRNLSSGSSEQNFLIEKITHHHVVVTREVWSLSDDGAKLTKDRRMINMDGVTETRQVLLRQ
jgi:hypothetical protein